MKKNKQYKIIIKQVQQTESQVWALDIFNYMELISELCKTFQKIHALIPLIFSDIVCTKYLLSVLFYDFLQLTMLLS